jgi:uncharacterized membrane protein
MNKTRMEAFSDGVFAIVITLLVLNIHVPDGRSFTLQNLRPLVPPIGTFVLSFIMVGVYWVAHHHMLYFIKQVNRRLLWLNLLVLLCVVFIPFPASLLGTGFSNSLVVRLYGLTLIATNAAGLCFWLYAIAHPDLLVPQVTKEFARLVVKVHSAPMFGYALAVVLAGWSPTVSLIIFAGVPLFFILPNPLLERRIGTATRVEAQVSE